MRATVDPTPRYGNGGSCKTGSDSDKRNIAASGAYLVLVQRSSRLASGIELSPPKSFHDLTPILDHSTLHNLQLSECATYLSMLQKHTMQSLVLAFEIPLPMVSLDTLIL